MRVFGPLIVTLVCLAACGKAPAPATDSAGPTPPIAPAAEQPIPGQPADDYSSDTVHTDVAGLPAAAGSTHYFPPDPGGDHTGPASLQDALCQLTPGDRLVVRAGEHAGPVTIGPDCAAGEQGKPIEVYFEADAVITVASDVTALTLASDHWAFAGMEVEGGPFQSTLVVIDGARDLALRNCHIHGGNGDGVLIGPGSAGVSLQRCHLHHFGVYVDDLPDAPPRGQSAAIRIAPGTSDIAVTQAGIHNVLGQPIVVVAPEAWAASGGEQLPAAANVVASDIQFREWTKN